MQVLGLLFGIFSIMGMFVAFLPFLGWMNWDIIPYALVGLVIGIMGTVTTKRSKDLGIAAIASCFIAIIVGIIRLKIGGGIF